MLNTLRRGTASLSKPLITSPCVPRYSHLCTKASWHVNCAPRVASSVTIRKFTSYNQCRAPSEGIAAARAEQDEEEYSASQSTSDARSYNGANDGPITRFQELVERGLVSEQVVKSVTQDMRLDKMTEVQSLTISESLKGVDILAQARTGTGKTLAFLIPLVQNIIQKDPALEHRIRSGAGRASISDIRAIIVSPTRELAVQIATEAAKVVHHTNVIVQTAVGGSSKRQDLMIMRKEGCHILVGTPGRLIDLLEDRYSGVSAPNLSCFVLDEADRLLDQGFLPDIRAMQSHLPHRQDVDRQTLLYSATVPREVIQVVRETMKPQFKFVRTVKDGELATHEKVSQKVVAVRAGENSMPALIELCKREIANKEAELPFKAIVYYGATADATLAAQTFSNLRSSGGGFGERSPLAPAKVIEMHSRLSQAQRTYAANKFRNASSAIMFSSDVTARGMDFPNVTHVIQMGLPPSQEQYIHRIGRTARADKTGEGWIFLLEPEIRAARHMLADMPLESDKTLETATVDMTRQAELPSHVAEILSQTGEAFQRVPEYAKRASYMANLGLMSKLPNKQKVIDILNNRAIYGWGMEKPPGMSPSLASKLGYTGLNGVELDYDTRSPDRLRSRGARAGAFGDYGRGSNERGGFGERSFGRSGSEGRGFGGSDFGGRESRGRGFEGRDSGGRGFGGRESGGRGFGRNDSSRSNFGARDYGNRDTDGGFQQRDRSSSRRY